MKKNTYKILIFLILIIYFLGTNIFNLFLKNEIRFVGFNIVNSIYLILIISCIIISNIIFKKEKFTDKDTPVLFRKKISEAVANSFVSSTVFTIVLTLLLYQFLDNILLFLNIKDGIINYTIYALKIFFVSFPFLGLEITILRYFYQIDCYNKIIKIVALKLLIFILLTFLLFFKYTYSSILYAKLITDMLLLYFYTKTCFKLTIFKQYRTKN